MYGFGFSRMEGSEGNRLLAIGIGGCAGSRGIEYKTDNLIIAPTILYYLSHFNRFRADTLYEDW
jgi:hypothetical protein